ncbi:MAG: D-arabinono-1,4-lactone oxidase [Bacillaceae bacterium]
MFLVKNKKYYNWSESVQFCPNKIAYPESIDEVIELVKEANIHKQGIRVVGSAHSFTPLIETKEVLVSLDKLQGIIHIDKNSKVAEVWAGTKLYELSELLFQRGYALENMGDINVQSVAGALLTGTHGTGASFGILATQIVEMTVVTGNGEVLTCSCEENEFIFHGLAVSFGMLGIVVKMKLKVVEATPFLLKSVKMTVEDVLSSLPTLKEENKHFEFYFFPYGDGVQVKAMNPTDQMPKSLKWEKMKTNFIENTVFYGLSEMCRLSPSMTTSISKLSSNLVAVFEYIGYSHELFATERKVKFNEMEYSIPVDKIEEVIRRIREVIKEKKCQVHFPIECRFVKGDLFWLSPAYRRDSAYIAVHMYKGMEYKEYFREMETIFQEVGGRPHWAKLHTMDHEQLIERYPRLPEFMELRKKLDKNGIFMNEYLRKVFRYE